MMSPRVRSLPLRTDQARTREASGNHRGSLGPVSVPFGDGGNPSPSGVGKVRVTWSSATLKAGSAYEERAQGASRVDPKI
jgi:hypothetical protein